MKKKTKNSNSFSLKYWYILINKVSNYELEFYFVINGEIKNNNEDNIISDNVDENNEIQKVLKILMNKNTKKKNNMKGMKNI